MIRSLISKILNPLIKITVNFTVILVLKIYGYNFRRFFVLETLARIPYFSFLSVLHLYQSLGIHPAIELLNLHYKESVNEEYHLLIMEELGASKSLFDRLLARAVGVFYYWINVALYIIAPSSAYYLMELVEDHAANSYEEFIEIKKEELLAQNAGPIATKYFFLNSSRMTPPPKGEQTNINLYQVFDSIRLDEVVHTKDMKDCKTLPSLYSHNVGTEMENNRNGKQF